MSLTHLSLFSGIGGLDIAAEMAGFETVGQCEWADYPTKVLEKHWPGLPRWRDIRTLTGESFYERTGLRTVDVISGGFPCQPFSLAGQRRGTADDRYLWPEMLRVVSELKPTWVIGENVAGLVSMVKSRKALRVEGRAVNLFEDAYHYEATWIRQEDMLLVELIGDLERLGYSVQAFIIPACAVGASHRRDRIALIAHANRFRLEHGSEVTNGTREHHIPEQLEGVCPDVADRRGVGLAQAGTEQQTAGATRGSQGRGNRSIRGHTQGGIPGEERKVQGGTHPTPEELVMMWPTPTTGAGLCGGTGNYNQLMTLTEEGAITEEERRSMSQGNGGQLNPAWVAWLMAFPPGWTDIG